jgi:hypothetical protein
MESGKEWRENPRQTDRCIERETRTLIEPEENSRTVVVQIFSGSVGGKRQTRGDRAGLSQEVNNKRVDDVASLLLRLRD